MKNKKLTVTIGIPAYNEEANIGYLLRDLLKQKEDGFVLKKIIVNSDGSSDRTNEEVKKFKSNKIKLIDNKIRLGQAARQNGIIKIATSDILILLNADIAVKDRQFLTKLTAPIISKNADFTSGNLLPLEPENFFERILYMSVLFKKDIYENFRQGNNVMTCHGPARAFSNKYYKSFSFKSSIGEDAYSYFWGLDKGLTYKYCSDANLFYKLPSNYQDHERQSLRYLSSYRLMKVKFGKENVESYQLPSYLMIKYFFKYLLKYPFELISYAIILTFIKIKSFLTNDVNEMWEMSKSSKLLKS